MSCSARLPALSSRARKVTWNARYCRSPTTELPSLHRQPACPGQNKPADPRVFSSAGLLSHFTHLEFSGVSMPSLRDQMAHLSDFLNFESARAVAFRALHAHDEREPKPALGVDKLSHSDWIMVGGYYPLPVSLGAKNLSECCPWRRLGCFNGHYFSVPSQGHYRKDGTQESAVRYPE